MKKSSAVVPINVDSSTSKFLNKGKTIRRVWQVLLQNLFQKVSFLHYFLLSLINRKKHFFNLTTVDCLGRHLTILFSRMIFPKGCPGGGG